MNYCILLTGIPASGKSSMAEFLAGELGLPVISKDRIKELMYDVLGFRSREEKVRLGIASMDIMYYMAEQLMKRKQPFILENNFENISKESLFKILDQYSYRAITVTLTGDYKIIYQRFLERDNGSERHRGHVVNDCYPETSPCKKIPAISYESFVAGIVNRGMDKFVANGPHIILDTTDFGRVDVDDLLQKVIVYKEQIIHDRSELITKEKNSMN